MKSCNQFIVIYHSQPLLPTEVYYLSVDYKWRRKRREREKERERERKKEVEINRIIVGRETAEHLLKPQGGSL